MFTIPTIKPVKKTDLAESVHRQHLDDESNVPWYRIVRRVQVVQALEAVQDLIAVSLCVGLFCAMALQMKSIFSLLFTTFGFHEVTPIFSSFSSWWNCSC
jgi:hypothetical protein